MEFLRAIGPVFNFLLLALALIFFTRKQIRKLFQERRDRIADALGRAADAQDQARHTAEDIAEAQQAADAEARAQLAEAKAQAEANTAAADAETAREVAECRARWGKTPTELFESLGHFDFGGGGFHCVHMTEHDLDIFRARGLWVITNPGSNAKLASGIAPLRQMREFGIRMAIGAPRRAIVAQFLIEAATISACGGVLGLLVGSLGSALLSAAIFERIDLPTLPVALGAFLFSVLLGMFFGFYPAGKASKMQPVDALRSQ